MKLRFLDDLELKQFAKLVFDMTRRQVWLGGKVEFNYDHYTKTTRKEDDWPEDVEFPKLGSGVIWTMSPEVELGGHKIRVCVSASPSDFGRGKGCRVRIFVDGALGYPGGTYLQRDWIRWWENWATRIARIEVEEGGRTGPVDRRDFLILEAIDRLRGAQVRHLPGPVDSAAEEAVREVEALIQKGSDL